MSVEKTKTSTISRTSANETVECDGYCGEEVRASKTVDVLAGTVIGEWNQPEAHVGVKGVDGGHPEVEKWCLWCADDQFGIKSPSVKRRIRQKYQYITPSNVASFLLGMVLMLVAASVMVV